jgi:hypothetical protein
MSKMVKLITVGILLPGVNILLSWGKAIPQVVI